MSVIGFGLVAARMSGASARPLSIALFSCSVLNMLSIAFSSVCGTLRLSLAQRRRGSPNGHLRA
eukprot:2253672-Pyramimonas_sp.AAC.1